MQTISGLNRNEEHATHFKLRGLKAPPQLIRPLDWSLATGGVCLTHPSGVLGRPPACRCVHSASAFCGCAMCSGYLLAVSCHLLVRNRQVTLPVGCRVDAKKNQFTPTCVQPGASPFRWYVVSSDGGPPGQVEEVGHAPDDSNMPFEVRAHHVLPTESKLLHTHVVFCQPRDTPRRNGARHDNRAS